MKLKIKTLFIFVFLFKIAKGQKQVLSENDNYIFRSIDSLKTTYSIKTAEGVRVIALYKDGVFEYEQQFIPSHNAFTAGKWTIKKDSLLVLDTKKKLVNKVFVRRSRNETLTRYKMIDFNRRTMYIKPGYFIKDLDNL